MHNNTYSKEEIDSKINVLTDSLYNLILDRKSIDLDRKSIDSDIQSVKKQIKSWQELELNQHKLFEDEY